MDALLEEYESIRQLKDDMITAYESICVINEEIKKKFIAIILEVCNTESLSICMRKLRDYDYNTYIHSVRVGIYSMLIGFLLDYDEVFITEIGIAGLLHDIGKKFIPIEIINKKEGLSQLEFILVQAHVSMSTYYIKKKYNFINKNIVSGVYQHHERLDGTGYPRCLMNDEISVPGRILAIADIYEAYSSNRPYHESRTAQQTTEFMQALNGLDTDILNKFTDCLNYDTGKVEINTINRAFL